jgi:hypothetical protein
MLTFNDYPLLLNDPGKELASWLDRWYSLDDLRIFAAEAVSRTINLNVPLPNWPAPPRIKLNSLYIPMGASRWAFGLFLIDEDTRKKFETAENTYGTLKFDNIAETGDNPNGISYRLYMLPPRRLTIDTATCPAAWLLPLVDERYFWQYQDIGVNADLDSTTWANLIDDMGDLGGATIEYDSIETDYGTPNITNLPRDYENFGLMLDAVAFSIGKRLIVIGSESGTLTYKLIGPSTASQLLDDNASIKSHYLTGGEGGVFFNVSVTNWNRLPTTLRLVINKTDAHDVTSSEAIDDSVGNDEQMGTIVTIHDSDIRTVLTGASADSLAQKYAEDWYKWRLKSFDVTCAGNVDWKHTGYEDAVWHHFAVQHCGQEADYSAFTRVWTLPENFGVAEPVQGSGTIIGILDEDLTFEGTADVSIYDGASPDGGADTTKTLADCWTWLLTSDKKLSLGFHVEVDRTTKRIIACRECAVDA